MNLLIYDSYIWKSNWKIISDDNEISSICFVLSCNCLFKSCSVFRFCRVKEIKSAFYSLSKVLITFHFSQLIPLISAYNIARLRLKVRSTLFLFWRRTIFSFEIANMNTIIKSDELIIFGLIENQKLKLIGYSKFLCI